MYKRIDFSNLGGNPLDQQSLELMQSSYTDVLAGLAAFVGDKVIIAGVVIVGANVSDGWIVVNGEFIKFIGGPLGAGVVVQDTASYTPLFQDNVARPVEYIKTATCGTPATFPFSDLKRLNTLEEVWLPGDIKTIDCNAEYIAANFDGTGLGLNHRKGWAVCNGQNGTKDRGGRVSVGYSTITIDPADNVWDVLYNTIGGVGGEKKHQLIVPELPNYDLKIKGGLPNQLTGAAGGGGGTNGLQNGADRGELLINSGGGDAAHENRQPFLVSLFIQKL